MGYNTKYFDHDAHYASKSTKELERLLKENIDFISRHGKFEHGMLNEYSERLKCLIAERIGKKHK